MKALVRDLAKVVGFPRERLAWHRRCRRLTTRWTTSEKTYVASHLSATIPSKLHLGCGFNVLPGWLNTDYYPPKDGTVHLDATSPYPWPDNTFDFIFSEHMIEHVPYAAGRRMLEECFRVLKPGGRIRISTPDLKFLISLYDATQDIQRAYIEWSTKRFISWAPEAADTFVINNFVRDWDHAFIFDEKTLAKAMTGAGFDTLSRCLLRESASPELRDLENDTRMPDGFLQLETLTLEATKPSAS
jgi:predicted SAM-dependent methyltransferase